MKISPGPLSLIYMASVFGLFAKDKIEEIDAIRLTEHFSYRENYEFGYSTANGHFKGRFNELSSISTKGKFFMGCTTNSTDSIPLHELDNEAFVYLSGFIYGNVTHVPKISDKEQLFDSEGEFHAACLHESKLTLVRDRLGTKPIFYGENSKYFMFAPDRQAFRLFNILEQPLVPETTLTYDGKISIDLSRPIVPHSTASETDLKNSITESVKVRMHDKRPAIMFSGGLDSSIMATLAHKFSKDIELITIGTERAQDLAYVEKVANELGIENLDITILQQDDIEEALNEIRLYMQTETAFLALAVPLHICCKIARKKNLRTIWNGQGAEELFAGYARYHRFLLENKDIDSIMLTDLKGLYKKDLERNDLVAANNSINGTYPFLDYNVVRNALAFPATAKISPNDERKIILRKTAKELGVPKLAYERPKKAIQYSTGIHKVVEKIIKRG